LDLVADFVAHLYRTGFGCSIELTPRQARAEAAFILERAYQGQLADGCAGALEDTRAYGKEGLMLILNSIVEALVSTQRQRYIDWVMLTKVGCLPWSTRKELAAFMLERYAVLLSPSLRRCGAEQLADFCSDLIQHLAGSDRAVREILAAPLRRAAH